MDAKTAIMGRIRSAPPRPRPAGAHAAPPAQTADPETLWAGFAERWTAVGGEARRVGDPQALLALLTELLAPLAPGPVTLAPSARAVPGLAEHLTALGLETIPPDATRGAAGAAAGITGVFRAVSYSASMVVDGREPGELTASLLPPFHIALIQRESLVATILEGITDVTARGWPRAAVFISGPSKTADIELNLVKGVHGPGRVVAVLLDYPADRPAGL